MDHDNHPNGQRSGLLLGIGAYLLWGLLPLYLKLLHGAGAGEVLAHRILWSLLLIVVLVVVLGRVAAVRAAARGRTLLLLTASAMLIAVNWLAYIWAVVNGHVLEGSLGYFINPLVSVALAVVVLGERIRPLQVAAIGIALVGVAVMVAANLLMAGGANWWLPLLIAVSFGLYGLIRKVAAIDPLGGLAVETLILGPPALAWLVHVELQGIAAFGHDRWLDLLLVAAGPITAVPLLMYTAAAKQLRYATLGLLQYSLPTLLFLEAVLLFGEPLRPVQLATFVLIWTGCALYAFDSVREARSGSEAGSAGGAVR